MDSEFSKEELREAKLIKQLYFWSFIAFGAIAPFAGIFYKKVLVTPDGVPAIKMIGYIFTVAPLIGFIASIISGYLSDKLQRGREIIAFFSGAAALTAVAVGFAGSDSIMALPLGSRFAWLFITVLIYRFAMMPINALLDSETMQFLNTSSDRKHYGKYRIWGTIGWAVATALVGWILHETGNYSLLFYIGAIAYLIFGVLGLKSSGKAKVKKINIPWKDLFGDKPFLIFLSFAFLTGVVENSTSTYLGYFFDDVMDTPFKIGLIFCFWTTFEIPVMHYSGQLIKFFGNRGLILFGLLLSAVKLYLFSLFTTETPFYWEVGAALIHGPSFAFLFLGTIDIVDRLSPKSMKATYMSLITIARYTLAASFGGLIGSMLIDQFGGAQFMKIGAVAMIFMAIYFTLFIRKVEESPED